MQLWLKSVAPQLLTNWTAPCRAPRLTAYQLGTITSAGLKKLTALASPSRAMLVDACRSGTTDELRAGTSASARHRIVDRLYTSSRPVEFEQYGLNTLSSVGQMPAT